MIDALTSYGTLFSGRRKASRLTNADAERELLAAINGESTAKAKVSVAERWYRGLGGMVVGERKIGDGPWEPIPNIAYYGQEPFVQFVHHPSETEEQQLTRAIFENGYADNTIEVSMIDGILYVLCGHCDKITHTGEVICCQWAGRMYVKYIEAGIKKSFGDR